MAASKSTIVQQSGQFSNAMEDTDPVTTRMPVILSKGIPGSLFLYEYKRLPINLQKEYNPPKVIKSRIKPKQQKVEIHLEMDKHSQNFNAGQARKLASKSNKNPLDLGGSMVETQVLASSTAVVNGPERFAIGVIHDNENGQREVHLNLVHGMIHLRQSYDYLDASDKKVDQEKKQAAEGDVAGQSKPVIGKPLTVRFARQDPKRMKLAQSKSLAAQQRLKEEEPWCETELFPASSSESQRERERLVSYQQESNAGIILVDPPEKFLPVLCPPRLAAAEKSPDEPRKSDAPLSSEEISKLSYQEQITERMKQAHIIQFSKLKEFVGQNKSEQDILSHLQRAAVPVRGNWVVNSTLLYTGEFVSSSGVSALGMCRARDQILYKFSQQESLTQKEASEVTNLPATDITDILQQLAYQVKKVGWKFKLPEDEEFIKKHPDYVDRLFKRFEGKVITMERRAEGERAALEEAKNVPVPSKKAKGAPRQRKTSTKSRKDSYSSDH